MKTIVKGIDVVLTEEQEAYVQKSLRKRERCRNSFRAMLRHLGFKEIKDQPRCFIHKTHNWFAEILDRETWDDVWMTGQGLKDSGGMPGGYLYFAPKEIEDEIVSALNNLTIK